MKTPFGEQIAKVASELSREYARACEATIVSLGGPTAIGGQVALRKVYGPLAEEYADTSGDALAHVYVRRDPGGFAIMTGLGPLPDGWRGHFSFA